MLSPLAGKPAIFPLSTPPKWHVERGDGRDTELTTCAGPLRFPEKWPVGRLKLSPNPSPYPSHSASASLVNLIQTVFYTRIFDLQAGTPIFATPGRGSSGPGLVGTLTGRHRLLAYLPMRTATESGRIAIRSM